MQPCGRLCRRVPSLMPPLPVRPRMRQDAAVALAAGLVLLTLGGGLLGALMLRGDAGPFLVVLGVELAAGREAAIPAGLSAGLAWHEAALTTNLIEWTMLLLGFPLLVLAGGRLARVRRVEVLFHRARLHAQAHPNTDVLGLGALTLFPFLPVGALTAVLVGEFLGLPSKRLLPVLLAAEVVANFGFALAASTFLGLFPDPRLPALLLASVLLAVAVAMAVVGSRRER